MNKRYKKERRRLSIIIGSVLLAICICIMAGYTLITYNNTQNSLINEAEKSANSKLASVVNKTPFSNDIDTTLSADTMVENPENTYVRISETTYDNGKAFEASEEIVSETDICRYSGFYGVSDKYDGLEKDFRFATLNYRKLVKSMKKEQLDRIRKYLKTPKYDSGEYYELLCTEFYVTRYGGEVIPKTVEIVKTSENNTWYVEDTPVEKFTLEINRSIKKCTHYAIGETYRNKIDTDYILHLPQNKDIKNIAKVMAKDACTLYKCAPFTFAYTSITQFSYTSGIENILRDEFSNMSYALSSYSLMYTHRFNVLDECIGQIVTADLIIFLIFLIIGAVLIFSVAHTFNTRAIQEEKRIEMTNAFAHNLKTPLLVISGFAENLIENVNTNKKDHYAKVIQDQTLVMDELVHRMLDFSRLDSGNAKLKKTEFELIALTDEIISKYDDSKISIATEAETVKVHADIGFIRLALENLVENAVKYCSGGEIKILIKNNYFEISNPCNGITDKDIKKLWQPYYRLDSSEKGNGIGLSIVKSVFDMHKFKYGAKLHSNIITFWFEY